MNLNEQLSKEFSAISDREWKEQVIRDLKGKDFDETLVWKDEDSLSHRPYYRQSDLSSLQLVDEIQAAQRTNLGWEILEEIEVIRDPLIELIKNKAKLNSIQIDKSERYHLGLEFYKNQGASPVEELALGLQHVVYYLDQLTESGLTAKEAWKNLDIRMAVGNSYFIEIAKGRAFRYLLKKVLQAYKIDEEVCITAMGSTYQLSDQDVHSNLLRTSTQAMSAVLGGYDAIYVPGFDELENSSTLAKRMARNIQLILKEESKFNQVIDPSSGSYYIESLTEKMSLEAWELFIKIENSGLQAFVESGKLEKLLNRSREARIEKYKKEERKFLGVNAFKNPLGKDINANNEFNFLAKEIRE